MTMQARRATSEPGADPRSGPSSVTAVVVGVEIVRTLPALLGGEDHKAKGELASQAELRLFPARKSLDG